MILKFILTIFSWIGTFIVNIITGLLPDSGISGQLQDIIVSMFTWTQQALNFMYLLFGETLFFVVPIATFILTTKYIGLPIIVLIRSFFVNSNE